MPRWLDLGEGTPHFRKTERPHIATEMIESGMRHDLAAELSRRLRDPFRAHVVGALSREAGQPFARRAKNQPRIGDLAAANRPGRQ